MELELFYFDRICRDITEDTQISRLDSYICVNEFIIFLRLLCISNNI